MTVAIMSNPNSEIAMMILNAGARPQLRNIDHGKQISTPLGMAVYLGQTSMISSMLVNATVDIDIDLREGIDNLTPLLLAVRRHGSKSRIAILLMEHGAHPLCMDERGVTALCVAASWAKYTLVKKNVDTNKGTR